MFKKGFKPKPNSFYIHDLIKVSFDFTDSPKVLILQILV